MKEADTVVADNAQGLMTLSTGSNDECHLLRSDTFIRMLNSILSQDPLKSG